MPKFDPSENKLRISGTSYPERTTPPSTDHIVPQTRNFDGDPGWTGDEAPDIDGGIPAGGDGLSADA